MELFAVKPHLTSNFHVNIHSALLFVFALSFGLAYSPVYAEAPEEISGAQTIGVEQAQVLYQSGAVFVDVRTERDWLSGHIDGAVNLDFSEDEFVILYVSDAIDRATPIVFYCDSPLGSASATASYFAVSWGYENVYYFRDGFFSWMASDHPVEFDIASR